ncbi:mobilization protein MobD [Thalassolituus oleivorans]|uniref:mobilization protein MobD n=1 Tax=Thalassolituus oleivorans TaxID=187493 RepID=UPI0023F38CCE|nr:mobilization protein MobD [Thalassolituus oleivorans]
MSTIHFVGGEKGGVGKSVVSRLLSQYCLDNKMMYAGLDADQSHSTLSRFYPEYTQAIDLDHFESADRIMELAIEQDVQVVVDLPAQSERFLNRWMEENGVAEMCEEMNVRCVYWYIIDDGMDSAGLLKGFLQRHGGSMPCAVVKNMGRGLDFGPADQSIAQVQLPPGSELNILTLPVLHTATMRKIDELNFSFWGAEHFADASQPHLTLMERQRTRVWVKKAFAEFDQVLAYSAAAAPAPVEPAPAPVASAPTPVAPAPQAPMAQTQMPLTNTRAAYVGVSYEAGAKASPSDTETADEPKSLYPFM